MTMINPGEDYRRRSGFPPAWQDGPGLFEVTTAGPDGQPRDRFVTNVRRLAGAGRAPGSALIGWAGWLLLILAGGVLAVSYAGQFAYLDAARGPRQVAASNIEAAMFDAGMIIFSLLALGLSRAGKSSRAERVLIMVCSLGSAGMGYAAADVASPRSVAAYVAPPLFLAVVVDRVIAVIRRHVLGDDEASPWAGLGRAAVRLARLAGLVALYTLRLVLDPKHTPGGLRRVVLAAAPLPGPPVTVIAVTPAPEAAPLPPGGTGTKKARLLAAYREHPAYGDRSCSARVAGELAPAAGLQPGTARTYLLAELDRLDAAGGDR